MEICAGVFGGDLDSELTVNLTFTDGTASECTPCFQASLLPLIALTPGHVIQKKREKPGNEATLIVGVWNLTSSGGGGGGGGEGGL